MFDRYFRDMDEAERLNLALEDWQAATGWWRDACRIYAHKLLMRMIRERDAGRAKLKAAAERARIKRERDGFCIAPSDEPCPYWRGYCRRDPACNN